ncbi:MAG: hypothetical protein KC613_25375, partial [Myxococcales bacterium]|nr:hypothetical protein [Myxococcales bacterium]
CGPDGCGGECGPGCGQGEVCDAGQCSAAGCPQGTFDCSGVCSRLIDDPDNCGSCGTDCPTRRGALTQCIEAECYLNCPGMEGRAQSVDFDNDPQHCGGCGVQCPGALGGQPTCNGGQCQSPCSRGEQVCDGVCVDLDDDPEHCGACGNACGEGAWCNSGECVCNGRRETWCGESRCADLNSDPDECGVCGNACPAAAGGEAVCQAGECLNPCAEGREQGAVCGGECQDVAVDLNNCGECGVRCADALAGANVGRNCQAGGNCYGNGNQCTAGACGLRITHSWDVTGGNGSTSCQEVCQAAGMVCAEVPWENCDNNNDRWQGIDLDGRLGAGCAIFDNRNGWGPRLLACDTRVGEDNGNPYYMTRRLMHCECVLAERVAPAEVIDAPGAYQLPGFGQNGSNRVVLRVPNGVDVVVDTAGCPADTTLELLSPAGDSVDANDDADGLGTCSRVSLPGAPAGDYTVVVAGFSGRAVGPLTLNVDW